MKNILYTFFLTSILCLSISCDNSQEIPGDMAQTGTFSLSLSAEEGNTFIKVPTKSGEEFVSPDSLQVALYDKKGKLVVSFDTYKKLKENNGKGMPLALPVGTYTVKAWYNNPNEVSAIPYLYGEEPFEVFYNGLTNVKMVCQYQCIKVQIQTTKVFDAICKDNYTVKLLTGSEESYLFTKANYWTFLRKTCSTMNAQVNVETVDGRLLSFSYDLVKKDNSDFQWKNSIIIKLDIQNSKSLKIETEVK